MFVKRIVIKGFKTLRSFDTEFNDNLNIIVGDNEAGKSTLLEAVNLALSGQMAGRSVAYDLDPYYFNNDLVTAYFSAIRKGDNAIPPEIVIEAYLNDGGTGELSALQGTNNTLGENCPGLSLSIVLNPGLADDFVTYVKNAKEPDIMPIEFLTVQWYSFAGNPVSVRSLPFRATIIDTSPLLGRWQRGTGASPNETRR